MKAILFLILLVSCSGFDKSYVLDRLWSYDKGLKITEGDFIDFQNKSGYCKLGGDTVYIASKPRALIVKVDKAKNLLYLKTIPEDSSSVYYYHNYYE